MTLIGDLSVNCAPRVQGVTQRFMFRADNVGGQLAADSQSLAIYSTPMLRRFMSPFQMAGVGNSVSWSLKPSS